MNERPIENPSAQQVSAHQREGRAARVALGAFALLMMILPWALKSAVHEFWVAHRFDPVMNEPFFWLYLRTSIATGSLLLLTLIVFRRSGPRVTSGLILTSSCCSILVLDRFLLGLVGLPLWRPDPSLIYRMRPNVEHDCSATGECRWKTNSYGFYDDEFPVEKPVGEVRGLFVGDSVTMGFRVRHDESYPNLLEAELNRAPPSPKRHYQMINAAVEGYSTYQELGMLREALRFKPDFVLMGFCMNDVTEPFLIDRNFGGTGVRYGEVIQFGNPILSYLVNETGFGRAILNLPRLRASFSAKEKTVEESGLSVWGLSTLKRDDPRARAGWDLVLRDLDLASQLTKEKGVRFIFVIFPHIFQLFDPSLREPQRILLEHCRVAGIECLDFTPIVAQALTARGMGKDVFPDYYVDDYHFSPRGHVLVAQELGRYLRSTNTFSK